jgi:hypothetical protein
MLLQYEPTHIALYDLDTTTLLPTFHGFIIIIKKVNITEQHHRYKAHVKTGRPSSCRYGETSKHISLRNNTPSIPEQLHNEH